MLYTSVFGHKDVKTKLTRLVESNNRTGPFLFCGPPCIGKRTVAFETARYLLCLKNPSDSCTCESCRLFPSHPDFLAIRATERIKVENINELLAFSSTVPFLSSLKVAVVDNAENMTWEASNRLLKLFEEPPTCFSFFIIVSDPVRIIPTIRSRCILYSFDIPDQDEIVNIFHKRLGFELQEARLLGSLSRVVASDVFARAGDCLKYREMALDFVINFHKRNILEIMDFVDKIPATDLPLFVDILVLVLTDLLLLKKNTGDITNVNIRERLLRLSNEFSEEILLAITTLIAQTKKRNLVSTNISLSLKNAFIKSYEISKQFERVKK